MHLCNNFLNKNIVIWPKSLFIVKLWVIAYDAEIMLFYNIFKFYVYLKDILVISDYCHCLKTAKYFPFRTVAYSNLVRNTNFDSSNFLKLFCIYPKAKKTARLHSFLTRAPANFFRFRTKMNSEHDIFITVNFKAI